MSWALFRRVVAWLVLPCALSAGSGVALAQSGVPAPPVRSTIDGNGVDLASHNVVASHTDVSIGPSGHLGLSFSRQWVQSGWRYLEIPTLEGSVNNPVVSFLGATVAFKTASGGGFETELQTGATLNATRTLFRAADGTEIEFAYSSYILLPMASQIGRPTKVTFPDGVVWSYHYEDVSYTIDDPEPIFIPPPACYQNPTGNECLNAYAIFQSEWDKWRAKQGTYYNSRLASITSSTGYQLKLTHASNTPSASDDWRTLAEVKAINNAAEYCSPTGACTLSIAWPSATYTGTGTAPYLTSATYTDAEGRTTTYSYTGGKLSGIRPPGASTDTVSYAYTGATLTSATIAGAGTTTYSFVGGTTTVTDPLSNQRIASFDSSRAIISDQNELGQITQFAYCGVSDANCPLGLLKTVTAPELNSVTYAYDTRGNVTSTTHTRKPGSSTTPATITTSAHFPGCTPSTQKICNKPDWTTDARNQVTEYTYDPDHGGLLTVTLPADEGGVHPQTRITYDDYQAYYKNSGGSIVASGADIALPTQVNSCRTSSSCTNGIDERRTTIGYGPQTPGVPNNLLPVSSTTSRGDGALAATTSITYDQYGRSKTIDGPQPGTADLTFFNRSIGGLTTGVISPDPDGSGPALYPAVRYDYRFDGQIDFVRTGTVTVQSDAAWSGFAELQRQTTGYDSYQRPIRVVLNSGGTDYQIVDQLYDTVGRVQCSMVRMDTGNWGSLPANCNPTGSTGTDRVTYNHYDALGRVWKVTSGFGTDVATDQTMTFTANGQLETLTDGEGNKTTYRYDGHDRRDAAYFPVTASGAGISAVCGPGNPCDYDLVGYDDNGNVTSFTTRAVETLTMTYDNLNRLIRKTVPERSGLDRTHTRDVFYSYDLFGNMGSACFGSTSSTPEIVSAECINNTFNTLGQLVDTTTTMDGNSRTLAYEYDVAGNRLSLTYPDSDPLDPKFISYARHPSGAFGSLWLNGTGAMIQTRFDSAGRLDRLYRYNTLAGAWGPETAFAYDPLSRLGAFSFGFNAGSSSYNQTTSFTYNPASQIATSVRTNDAYAFLGYNTVDRKYAANGRNQYSSATSFTFAYDSNANLSQSVGPNAVSSSATNDFVYDVENRLVLNVETLAGGTPNNLTVTLRYDPLGRLHEIKKDVLSPLSNTARRFVYDGDALVAEYTGANPGTMLRRYVHGPAAGDDPLVWFEGNTVADSARRYLYADERGSIVAVTNGAGIVSDINKYDEYGIPAASNTGAFQYTGQVWLPELGMYDYKARMYSPSLGRFMQTDPVGYGDGMNVYAYVHNDPVNAVDPTGRWYCSDDPYVPGTGEPCWTRDGTLLCAYFDTACGYAAYWYWAATGTPWDYAMFVRPTTEYDPWAQSISVSQYCWYYGVCDTSPPVPSNGGLICTGTVCDSPGQPLAEPEAPAPARSEPLDVPICAVSIAGAECVYLTPPEACAMSTDMQPDLLMGQVYAGELALAAARWGPNPVQQGAGGVSTIFSLHVYENNARISYSCR